MPAPTSKSRRGRSLPSCAERSRREIPVGGATAAFSAMHALFPRGTDRYMERTMFRQQMTDEPKSEDAPSNLMRPVPHEGEVRGGYPGHVMRSSVYTSWRLHRLGTLLWGVGLGAAGMLAYRALREEQDGRPRRDLRTGVGLNEEERIRRTRMRERIPFRDDDAPSIH
jgi:hypothetical protein